jgi:hypothetical protein
LASCFCDAWLIQFCNAGSIAFVQLIMAVNYGSFCLTFFCFPFYGAVPIAFWAACVSYFHNSLILIILIPFPATTSFAPCDHQAWS